MALKTNRVLAASALLLSVGVALAFVRCSSEDAGRVPHPASPVAQPTSLTSLPTTSRTTTAVQPQTATSAFSREVPYQSGELELRGYLCRPEGPGPFPAVVYNHGGNRGAIGGAPEESCQALADAGFVGFSPIRREELSLDGNLEDVFAGLDYARSLDYVDSDRIGIMGFSRGGLLTFMAATERADLDAIVLMAAAPPPPPQGGLYSLASAFPAPTLILVSQNDIPSLNNEGQDHVAIAGEMKDALESAGKEVDLIIYPPYEDNGHMMFFEIGEYWTDVEAFLRKHLGN